MHTPIQRVFIPVLLLVFYVSHLNAQLADTASVLKPSPVKTEKSSFGVLSMFSGNPGRAALYSLAVPSAGQLYNKKYWKVPIVLAIEGGVIAIVVDRIRVYNRWNQGMLDMSDGIINEFMGRTSLNAVKSVRDRAQANRDYAIIGLVIVHLFQTAEAFVNRHLIEFDVSEDLSITIPREQPLGLALSYRFN